jgi:ankyrin repeat protein
MLMDMLQEAAEAIRAGNIDGLKRMLEADPGLVHARVDGKRTLLHVATDWPGHYPNVRESIELLTASGADVNARISGDARHSETPLHWAASSGDMDALDALLEHGADIEATGAVIGGGTPLADAVAFRNWEAARRLIERGARSNLWQSAALGLMDRLDAELAADPAPDAQALTKAFWCACDGGQLAAAQRLASLGADRRWVGYDHLTPLGAAERSGNAELVAWLRSNG